jgi:16S rRNA (guanine(527)-N(7))-methyltransferase RsmG
MAEEESCFGQRWRSEEWLAESVADSLAALDLRIVRSARNVVDLGSGAGFPGLVLAHARRKALFTLVEREPDRAGFLERAVAEMGLTNVDVVTARADLDPAAFGGTHLVVSRSVASQDELLTWAAPLLAPAGACVQWGPRGRDRVWVASDPEAFAAASTATGIHLTEIRRVQVSESMRRHLFVYVRSDPGRLVPVDRPTKSGRPRTFVPDPPVPPAVGLVEDPE